MMKRLILIFSIIFLPLTASAQFYVTGDDPGRLRWNYIDTDNFRIIYPQGSDSLARVYGTNLEKYRIPVSRSSGYTPGGTGRLRMPVVLHAWNSSNGSVAWAPKRMDLFTIPSAYAPEALPWADMLAVHESRHVTQMQFGTTKALRPFNWAFGEMFNILVSIMYPGIDFMEGDAVITETAFSNSGRGRNAEFLNYYRVALDNGVIRKWGQWRFDSQKNYSPNYYALGYLTLGGIRTFYDCPEYMSDVYHDIAARPYHFGKFHSKAKSLAGKKRFNEVFQEIADTMNVIWRNEAQERAPFIPMESVTKEPRLYTDYISSLFCGNSLYALKKGHLNTPVLVKIDSLGKEDKIRDFSARTGKLKFHGNRIYWSETSVDERWSMQTRSRIRFMEGSLEYGIESWSRNRTLSGSDRLLYNPSVSSDGKSIACVEYRQDGSAYLVILDSDGSTVTAVKAPDGIQPIETAWIGNTPYVTGLSSEGYGIYKAEDFTCLMEPQPVMIKSFDSYADELIFVSDRTGADEMYHFNPSDGNLRQKTSLKYGGEDFTYSPDGKWLYYSSQTVKGKQLFRTAVSDLFDKQVDLSDRHEYFLAEKLTQQEKELACQDTKKSSEKVGFSQPHRYRKFPHMFNVHSWAPIYVNADNIMNMSFDRVYQAASLGATGIIQNRLSTAVGEFGYSAHRDPYNPSRWRHSGHAKMTYSGLYPVFEVSVDFNDRAARQYNPCAFLMNEGTGMSISSKELPSPYLQGSLKTYIPFSFSSGGWYSGVIPQMTYTLTNDFFNSSLPILSQRPSDGYAALGNVFMGSQPGKNRIMQYMSGSIRAYTMLGTANSAIYPRWGIGAEIGASSIMAASKYYSPMGYAYLYGYIPGITRTQGIKLTASYQTKLTDAPFGQGIVSIMPRGYINSPDLGSALSLRNTSIFKFTADYAIPIYIGDLSILGHFMFIKRMVLTPHFDYTHVADTGAAFWSAGGNLTFNLESIAWITWPCSLGISASYNGSNAFFQAQNSYGAQRFHIGPVFSVTF